MRVAFYAPMKPPDHPTPSGDRLMARQFIALLQRMGHEVALASRMVTRTTEPDAARLGVLFSGAQAEVARILAGPKPDLWFTYHLYHKAPDLIGPTVAGAFGIPYVVAEASYTPSRETGPWAAWQAPVRDALAQAAAVICMTRRDMAGVAALPRLNGRPTYLPPFLLDMPEDAPLLIDRDDHSQPPELLTVAMMRPGHKDESYRLLAEAVRRLPKNRVRLSIIGDGPCRAAVEARFAGMTNVRFLGALPAKEVQREMVLADLFVWPGIGEAYGMVFLEAQAAGLPVVALDQAGVPDVVCRDGAGVLVPFRQSDTDASAMASAILRLIADRTDLSLRRSAGRLFVRDNRSGVAATHILGDVLERLSDRRKRPSSPRGTEQAWQPVLEALDRLEATGQRIELWLRDDDAISDSPALRRLDRLCTEAGVSALLAVIPRGSDASLASRLRGSAALVACQHGIAHANHAEAGRKSIELADHCGTRTLLGHLMAYKAHLADLLPGFLPILVPPWNRIDPGIAGGLADAGFTGLSTFGRNVSDMERLLVRNTHIDLMDWRGGRVGKTAARLAEELVAEVPRALADDRRIGLLTHHLVHDTVAWDALAGLIEITRHHPAVRWRHPREVFAPD